MMNKDITFSIFSEKSQKIVLAFLTSTLLMIVAIQFLSGQNPDTKFGAMTAFQLILFNLVIGLLIAPAFMAGNKKPQLSIVSLSTAGLFFLLATVTIFGVQYLLSLNEVVFDTTMLLLWIACGILIFIQITTYSTSHFALVLYFAGFVLQFVVSFTDVVDGLLGRDTSTVSVDTMESAIVCLVLVFYVVSLLSTVGTRTTKIPADAGLGRRLSKALFHIEHGTIGAVLAIGFNNLQYFFWKQFNRQKTFADFYAWQITKKLDKGRAHKTLGDKQFSKDSLFTEAPGHDGSKWRDRPQQRQIDELISLGLKPNHKLIDYGCGSLRLGKHLIDFLEPEKYWGLDVTDRFYLDGLKMLGEELRNEKKPECAVISQQSLQQLRQEKPDFIVSFSVLKHVPENELDRYFDNVTGLMSDQTTLAITFSESSYEKQISGKSWSWSYNRIEKLIKERCPHHQVKIAMSKAQKERNGVVLNFCMIVAIPESNDS